MSRVANNGWRNDAYSKVTGQAKYTDDLRFPNMAHAVPVYSDFVHARIEHIHTEAAELVPGVLTVLTAKDIPGDNHIGQIIRDYRIFADDKVRYNGDVVALVVAETRELAIKAAALVRIEATPLPAVLDPEAALKADAPLVHEKHGSNIVNTHKIRRGDIERGFRAADIIIEEKFQTQFIEHAYMEPEVGIALPRGDGVLEIYGSMQHPFSTRRFVAACLGTDLSKIEVVGTPLGGGFGGKDDTAAVVCARTALAAKILNRPVKTMYKREWSMRESYKRHPYRISYKMGVNRQGHITAVQCNIIADAGAYCSVTPWVTWRSTVQCCGPYVVDHVHCDVTGVYTNNVVTGAMRGFGSPQVNFAIEQLVEIAAQKLGISAVEFRRRNMVKQGSITITGQELVGHKVSMGECLDTVLRHIDYESKIKRCSFGKSDSDEQYGIGVAMSYRGVSLGAEGVDFCAAIINAQVDGSVLVEVGVHENGQGSESAMSIIVANELGIDVESIRYRRSSTSSIPDSGNTVASRGTIMGGGAVTIAARELKKKIAEAVAEKFKCAAEEIQFQNNFIIGPRERVSFADAMRLMFQTQRFPYAFGVYKAPRVSWEEETGHGDAYFTWVYGCQAVELTVNRKTGKVKLLNCVAAHDVGNAISPQMVLGQIYGGMVMSIGYGLSEEVKIKDGKITNLNLNSYRIPRSMDVPEMSATLIQNHDPISPSGAKSIGEPANELMAPAIANAVFNATGQRHFALPIRVPPQAGAAAPRKIEEESCKL